MSIRAIIREGKAPSMFSLILSSSKNDKEKMCSCVHTYENFKLLIRDNN